MANARPAARRFPLDSDCCWAGGAGRAGTRRATERPARPAERRRRPQIPALYPGRSAPVLGWVGSDGPYAWPERSPRAPRSRRRLRAQVEADGARRIVVFALRELQEGEEITYDYRLPTEDIKIPCHCGAAECRGYLN